METIPQNCWETEVKVLNTDIDRLGHVNNVVYLRYVQEVAESHWNGIATPDQQQTSIWVVRRHRCWKPSGRERGKPGGIPRSPRRWALR